MPSVAQRTEELFTEAVEDSVKSVLEDAGVAAGDVSAFLSSLMSGIQSLVAAGTTAAADVSALVNSVLADVGITLSATAVDDIVDAVTIFVTGLAAL